PKTPSTLFEPDEIRQRHVVSNLNRLRSVSKQSRRHPDSVCIVCSHVIEGKEAERAGGRGPGDTRRTRKRHGRVSQTGSARCDGPAADGGKGGCRSDRKGTIIRYRIIDRPEFPRSVSSRWQNPCVVPVRFVIRSGQRL